MYQVRISYKILHQILYNKVELRFVLFWMNRIVHEVISFSHTQNLITGKKWKCCAFERATFVKLIRNGNIRCRWDYNWNILGITKCYTFCRSLQHLVTAQLHTELYFQSIEFRHIKRCLYMCIVMSKHCNSACSQLLIAISDISMHVKMINDDSQMSAAYANGIINIQSQLTHNSCKFYWLMLSRWVVMQTYINV